MWKMAEKSPIYAVHLYKTMNWWKYKCNSTKPLRQKHKKGVNKINKIILNFIVDFVFYVYLWCMYRNLKFQIDIAVYILPLKSMKV